MAVLVMVIVTINVNAQTYRSSVSFGGKTAHISSTFFCSPYNNNVVSFQKVTVSKYDFGSGKRSRRSKKSNTSSSIKTNVTDSTKPKAISPYDRIILEREKMNEVEKMAKKNREIREKKEREYRDSLYTIYCIKMDSVLIKKKITAKTMTFENIDDLFLGYGNSISDKVVFELTKNLFYAGMSDNEKLNKIDEIKSYVYFWEIDYKCSLKSIVTNRKRLESLKKYE